MRDRHASLFALAVRLLRGETIEREDEHGRRWRATHTALSLVLPGSGETGAVVEGDSYEVAERFEAIR